MDVISTISTKEGVYERIHIKTDVITNKHTLEDILSYTENKIQEGDIIYLSEKVSSIIQNRFIHIDDVKVSKLAKLLSGFVSNTPGSNLTNEQTMQVAIDQAGVLKILFAAGVAAITKPFGKKGYFYIIAGDDVRGIDAPDSKAIPPYDKCISLSPQNPDKIAQEVKEITGAHAVIIDANYRGVNVLGVSDPNMDKELLREIFIDNPLGQEREQTPLAIVRKK